MNYVSTWTVMEFIKTNIYTNIQEELFVHPLPKVVTSLDFRRCFNFSSFNSSDPSFVIVVRNVVADSSLDSSSFVFINVRMVRSKPVASVATTKNFDDISNCLVLIRNLLLKNIPNAATRLEVPNRDLEII